MDVTGRRSPRTRSDDQEADHHIYRAALFGSYPVAASSRTTGGHGPPVRDKAGGRQGARGDSGR